MMMCDELDAARRDRVSTCAYTVRGPRARVEQSIRFSLISIAALLGGPTAWAQLTDGCPAHVYLGNNPSGTDSPDWSEQAQGIANDGEHWFFTHNDITSATLFVGSLIKYEKNWRSVDGTDVGKIVRAGLPAELLAGGINHFGDPDHYGGYVFVPFEGNGELTAVVAAFRASDLEFVDWVDVSAHQPKAGWLAVDPVERLMYTSDDSLVAGTPLLAYELDMGKIENGVHGDFLGDLDTTSPEEFRVLDADGEDLHGVYSFMQGGVFTPWGDLYLIVGEADVPAESAHGGIHLFRRTTDGTAFRRIESSVNGGAEPGDAVFSYEYHPGFGTFGGLGEEPEGIDWWNQASDSDARYLGQLHAILLDNQVDDDNVWLKHYAVDYFCMDDQDSDGDGVSDTDEVYVHNTHPLLLDSDLDGLEDTADNCPFVANADQANLDGDAHGDLCDADADADGQSNTAERACGSDPLNAASLAADYDADGLPDCVDDDDDADGQLDADELACGSNPLDASSRSPNFDGDDLLDCLDPDDDNDDVIDEIDRCPATLIPEATPQSGVLGTNRYALVDADTVFDRNARNTHVRGAYTTGDTFGCSSTQIAGALGLGRGAYESGIPKGILESWIRGAR